VVQPPLQEPPSLLLANSSHALSEANQPNAALPLVESQQPQLHLQPNAILCPIVMTEEIPPCHLPYSDQQLLGAGPSNNSDNIFFGSIETFYEYSPNLPENSQNPPCFNLIDSLVHEARSEIIAEQNLYAFPQSFQNDQIYPYYAIEFPTISSEPQQQQEQPSPPLYPQSQNSSETLPSPPQIDNSSFSRSSHSHSSSYRPSQSPTAEFIDNGSISGGGSGGPSSISSSSCASSSLYGQGKKYCLFGMSVQEVHERKREQNKNAARRYREKKAKVLEKNKYEISRLNQRNQELREMETFLAEQIQFYKQLMISKVNS
jgi:hypothetical protein